MTNGEKIKALLKPRENQVKIYGDWVEIEIQSLNINFSCGLDWWNVEYKEPTTKNDLGVDLISRADVNRLICEYRDDATETGNERDLERAYGANAVGELISELPSVTPQEFKWILVSERLPEAGEYIGDVVRYYLVQNEYGDMMVASYDGIGWQQMYQHGYVEDKVVAWMTLPQKYREVKE